MDMCAYIQARRCARHRRQPRTAIASDHSPPSIDPHLRSLGWAGQPPRIYPYTGASQNSFEIAHHLRTHQPSRSTLSDIYTINYLSTYPSVHMTSVSPNALCGQVRPALTHSRRAIACDPGAQPRAFYTWLRIDAL